MQQPCMRHPNLQQEEFFGCHAFPWFRESGNWVHFEVDNWSQPSVFHGLLLSQLFDILKEQKWRAGLWNGHSLSSPLGVWVATSPSVALDRASAKRGYALSSVPPRVPNGWDFPVVLGLDLNINQCGRHRKLKNGEYIRRYLTGGREVFDLAELNIVDCSFFKPVYERFNQLPQVWDKVLCGSLVMCRCRRRHPEDFFKCGHGNPWTCGRTTNTPEADGWKQTVKKGTRQWRCPNCDWNKKNLKGSVTGET